jgi:hypothetical protein
MQQPAAAPGAGTSQMTYWLALGFSTQQLAGQLPLRQPPQDETMAPIWPFAAAWHSGYTVSDTCLIACGSRMLRAWPSAGEQKKGTHRRSAATADDVTRTATPPVRRAGGMTGGKVDVRRAREESSFPS